MSYFSPLHLIHDKDLDGATPDLLKKWRKEIMLHFSFGSLSVVQINGHEYDKQSVNEAFEILKEDYNFHWQLYRNKPLLDFLEKGDLRFFKDDIALKDFEDWEFQEKVFPYFTERYSAVITRITSKPTPKNITLLRLLRSSAIDIPPVYQSEIFADAYAHLNSRLKEFREIGQECFYPNKKYQLKPEVKEYVNPQIRNLLNLLPDDFFISIKEAYARDVHNHLTVQAFDSEKIHSLNMYSKETLQILLSGLNITDDYLDLPENQKVKEIVERIIASKRVSFNKKSTQTSTSVSPGRVLWLVFIAFVFIFRLVMAAERCGKSSNNRAYNNSYQAYQYQPLEKEELEELLGRAKEAGKDSASQRQFVQDLQKILKEKAAKDKPAQKTRSYKTQKPTEAYAPTPSVKEHQQVFNPQDLLGIWEITRTADDKAELSVKYAFLTYSGGKRIITYSNPQTGKVYKVIQEFTYKAQTDNYYSGSLLMEFPTIEYKDCTAIQGQKLLRLAAKKQDLEKDYYSKSITLDFTIPANRSNGLGLGQETYQMSIGEGSVAAYAKGKIRNNYIVKYVDKLLEAKGVSTGPSNRPLRFYTEKTGQYIVGKSGKHRDTIAQIIIAPNERIYLKPLPRKLSKKSFPVLNLENISMVDKRGKYVRGNAVIIFDRKKGFSFEADF